MQSLSSGRGCRYLTLDDHATLAAAKGDPDGFVAGLDGPVTLDEVQRAPGLFLAIKADVDRDRRSGRFLLTGSANVLLLPDIADSLAGRMEVLSLWPLSSAENAGVPATNLADLLFDGPMDALNISPCDRAQLVGQLLSGGFPEAVSRSSARQRATWFDSYMQAIMQRDVRDLARVGGEMSLLGFLRAAAARTGQLLNVAELARDVGVSPNTAKSWLSILEASGLVYLLQPWHSNVTKRLVKTPKLYFLDTGLCACLTQWSSPETQEAGAMSGAIFETWVVVELLKSNWHCGKMALFYYSRNKGQREIDLLIESDGALYPVECKKSASPTLNALQAMVTLEHLGVKVGPGAVICLVTQPLPLNRSVMAVPAGLL